MLNTPLTDVDRSRSPVEVAATRSASRVVSLLGEVRSSMQSNRYSHQTRIRERTGDYAWDCSALTEWVLLRAGLRKAHASLASERAVARDFVRVIERAPLLETNHRASRGWHRIEHIRDVRAGDVFAWRRPRDWGPGATGHVGFVSAAPVQVQGWRERMTGTNPVEVTAWVVRIIDSTSFAHDNDSRTDDPDGGIGEGELLFLADDAGRVTHYGWFGVRSEAVVTTPTVFGRLAD